MLTAQAVVRSTTPLEGLGWLLTQHRSFLHSWNHCLQCITSLDTQFCFSAVLIKILDSEEFHASLQDSPAVSGWRGKCMHACVKGMEYVFRFFLISIKHCNDNSMGKNDWQLYYISPLLNEWRLTRNISQQTPLLKKKDSTIHYCKQI